MDFHRFRHTIILHGHYKHYKNSVLYIVRLAPALILHRFYFYNEIERRLKESLFSAGEVYEKTKRKHKNIYKWKKVIYVRAQEFQRAMKRPRENSTKLFAVFEGSVLLFLVWGLWSGEKDGWKVESSERSTASFFHGVFVNERVQSVQSVVEVRLVELFFWGVCLFWFVWMNCGWIWLFFYNYRCNFILISDFLNIYFILSILIVVNFVRNFSFYFKSKIFFLIYINFSLHNEWVIKKNVLKIHPFRMYQIENRRPYLSFRL